MSATMARQGGRVQLEQSDMRLALTMANMANGGFSRAAIEEMQHLMKKPHAEAPEEKKRGIEFPGIEMVNTATARYPAILCQNQTDGCLPCQNGTAKNPQTRWRRNGTDSSPPDQCRLPTPQPTTPLPRVPSPTRTPPTSPGNNAGAQHSQMVNLLAVYRYWNSSLPRAECFALDAYAQDSQHDINFNPDMLTDEGTFTG